MWITIQNDTTEGATSYLRNNTTQEVTQSSSLENSSTEESILSTDDTYEWGMEQEIGTEWSFGSEEIDLAHVFKADAVDESDKDRKVAMFWEAKSLPGSGKVNKKYVKKYKVFFDKKNSGKKVKVVR